MDKRLIFCLIFSSTFTFLLAQDSIRAKKVKILPLPTFGHSPETRTYVGLVSLFTLDFYNDTVTRISNAKLEGTYTWNKQLIIEGGWNYFFQKEKWFSKGLIHYSFFPDLYYGVGPNTPENNRTAFDSRRVIMEGFGLKKVGAKIFSGLNLKYMRYSNVDADTSTHYFSELKYASNVGLGFTFLLDQRNNLLGATKGKYLNVNTSYYYSNRQYVKIFLDARAYKIWNEKWVWANRFFHESNFGTPPFFDYAFLGGDKFVRGFYYGRFRDKNLSSLQSEIRFPLFWRIGFAGFGGISLLFSDFNSFDAKHNAGIGLRFLIDKKDKTYMRFDYAIGEGKNSGFYVAFGEAF